MGLQNFREIFRDPVARGALWHTLELAGCFVVAVNALGLALALALNRTVKTRHFLRLLFFLPVVLSPLAISFIWRWIFDYQGALNLVLGDVGLGSWRQVWLGDPSIALWTILVVMIWQFSGLAMVLYLAGLQGIPDDVYEATLVDGASGWLRLRRVVLPLLAPAVTVTATYTLIIGLRVFDQVMALTQGGPVGASETLSWQIYEQTFALGHFGYGAAFGSDPDGPDQRARADAARGSPTERSEALRWGVRYTRRTLVREVAVIVLAVVFCLPFYLLVALALESTSESYRAPLSFPWPPHLGNFSQAWSTGGQAALSHALWSSLVITVSSVVALIVVGSLCAYALARHRSRVSTTLYLLFVLGIILPFQLAIIPLFVAMRDLGLVGDYLGMIVLNVGLLMPLTVFLYTGFIRALPRDYEEAAWVDGAGILRTYARVVFPLLWPITATVAVLAGIIVWNEFFVALIFLAGQPNSRRSRSLCTRSKGDYVSRWNLIFAGVAITIAPILVIFLFAQRHLIRGFSAGVKG